MPLEGRRLWEIGSWGNASDHIGRRWEVLGQQALTDRLLSDERLWLGPRPPRLLTLSESATLQAQLQSLGLPNPDALVADRVDGRLVVRPVDFKWSLETAAYRQISGAALSELIAHPESPLPELIRALGPECDVAPEPTDGFFLAPDSQPNRHFLESHANHRQEYPLEPKDVVFESVDGVAFFSPLPWWPQALRLADLDRMSRSLEGVDGAERYYRLGAGVGGALQKLQTSVFAAEPAAIDAAAATEALLLEQRLRTSLEAVEHLRKLIDQRNERVRRARELARCPYSFRTLLGDVRQAGIPVPEIEGLDRVEKERWGRVHRAVVEAHRAALNAAGLELIGRGLSEVAALAELERRRPEFEARARALGHRLIRKEIASPSAPQAAVGTEAGRG